MEFTLDVPRYALADGGGLRFTPFGDAAGYAEYAALSSRRHDLVSGEPAVTRFTYRYALPKGWAPVEVPEAAAADTPHGAFEVRYRREAEALVAEGHVTFKTARVAAADYPAFRELAAQGSIARSRERSASLRRRRKGLSIVVRLPAAPPPRRSSPSRWAAPARAAGGPAAAPPGAPARGGARPPEQRRRRPGGRVARARAPGRGSLGAPRCGAPRAPGARRRRRGPAPRRGGRRRPTDPVALVALRRLSELAEESADRAAEIDAGLAPLVDGGRLAGLAAYRARIARVTAAEVRGDHAAPPRSAARTAP